MGGAELTGHGGELWSAPLNTKRSRNRHERCLAIRGLLNPTIYRSSSIFRVELELCRLRKLISRMLGRKRLFRPRNGAAFQWLVSFNRGAAQWRKNLRSLKTFFMKH